MSTRFPASPRTPAVMGQHKTVYTDAQWNALDALKDDRYVLGIAREEFVNAVFTPAGEVLPAPAAAECAAYQRELAAAAAADGNYEGAALLAKKADEMQAHIAENRFLFIVNEHGTALIYYQCVTPTNPDLPALKES